MLEEFELGHMENFTDKVLLKFLQHQRLKTLRLVDCPRLTPEGTKKAFLNKTSALDKLHLRILEYLTPDTMQVIIDACPELKEIQFILSGWSSKFE